MAVKRMRSQTDVVTAARRRIKNVFANGVKVYLSFSGGKDSLVMGDIIIRLIRGGEIDPSMLTVVFIDEEAIYGSAIDEVAEWRVKFLEAGAAFQWWCIEVKHFSCYNALTNDESYTCWDRTKKDVWVRTPPPFAIRNHPQLLPGVDNYQTFLPKISMDGITLVGVRSAESVQRLYYMSKANTGAGGVMTGKNMIYPIYDWKANDVWLYLKEHRIDIPDIYLWMYQAGASKNQMRICQLFSVDCVSSLIHIAEYEPGLWERILRREPNAYLAMLYWDTELYRRSSNRRRDNEGSRDYKELVLNMLVKEPNKHFTTDLERSIVNEYRKLVIKTGGIARQRDYKRMYNALVAGDPKKRELRAIISSIYGAYADYACATCGGEGK